MTILLKCLKPWRDRQRMISVIIMATALLAPVGRAAAGVCYRPDELRADAEAKLADFLKEAALACSSVFHESLFDSWNLFETHPEIADGLAQADKVRAPYYERFFGGEGWQARWQEVELTVSGYAGQVIQQRAPGRPGCVKLQQELVAFRTGGWTAYSAAVDRFFATMRPQVEMCAE